MIEYIIAVTSPARINLCWAILFLFLPTSMDNITLAMSSYWIDSLLTATLELKPSASRSGTE